jgi:aryl-alcohol dehydrogenase-like predicted oxidoreductase
MRYRSLGSTGIRVSEIGFGAWGIGGNAGGAVAYGPTDDRESARAIRAALDRGVNFFDTADFYGFGHSEAMLGAELRGMRERVVIASKAGMLDAQGTQDFSPVYLRAALERSLQRLCTDYLDLLQLHSPTLEVLRRDPTVLQALEQFVREGKIRAYGISARSPDDAAAAIGDWGFPCVQVNFNLVDQRACENGLFDLCRQFGVGVIVRTPLCFGYLSGKYGADAQLSESDHRSRWSEEQRKRWADAPEAFRSALVNPIGQTPAQLALRFCLSFDAVSTTIPGMQAVAEVEENTQAGDLGPLEASERETLQAAYRGREFFVSGATRL